jgi:hypothetical protein
LKRQAPNPGAVNAFYDAAAIGMALGRHAKRVANLLN